MARSPEDPGGRPPLRPFGVAEVPAPTGSESRALDRRAIEALGVPQTTLMENAGRSAAEVLARLHPQGRVIGVVGSGNNGGDGLVLLRSLAAWGREVSAIVVGDRPADDPLLHGWDLPLRSDTGLGDSEEAWDAALGPADVLVDALLGTGAKGPPRERESAAIDALNRHRSPILALDVPSGIDADTGAVPGVAVRASATIAFGFPKLGSLLHPARARAGRLIAVEIGFPPVDALLDPPPAVLVTPGWATRHRPGRKLDTHKREVGSLLLLAGDVGMAGAAAMAARAAFRAGAGVVRVASAPENRVVLQAAVPEAIFVDREDGEALEAAASASDAVAAGPGLGTHQAAAAALLRVLRLPSTGRPLLLDAGALTLIGSGEVPPPGELSRDRELLLTPHVAEMARISRYDVPEILPRRPAVARELAAEFGCALLLKGTPSVVAAADGRLFVDAVGTSDLATAGMGDVLAGVAGALLAQGCPSAVAGALALHRTGRGARLARRGAGLLPSDVIERLPDALAETGDGESDLGLAHVLFDQDPPR